MWLVGRCWLETARMAVSVLVTSVMTIMVAMFLLVFVIVLGSAVVVAMFTTVSWLPVVVVAVTMIAIGRPLPINSGRRAVRRRIAVIAARGGLGLLRGRRSVQQVVEHAFGD